MSSKKICFVISPIGEDGSEVRKRADQVLKHVITPPAVKCGYETLRADKIAEPGLITTQIIQQILDAPLVVADLTGMNPNVFYELAVRHAIRKPLVQIIHKGDTIPFDVAGMRTISVDYHDLDSVEEAKTEIERQIKNVEGKTPEQIESPISATVDLQTLKRSDKPEDRTLGEILSAITQLRSEVNQLKSGASTISATPELEREMRKKAVRQRIQMLRSVKTDLLEQCKEVAVGGGERSPEFSAINEQLAEIDKELEHLQFAEKYLPFAA